MRERKPSIRARDGRGRVIRAVETVEQDLEAARLRSQSLTVRQVATTLGIAVGTAHAAIERGYAAIPTENDVAVKANELVKLDIIEQRLADLLAKDEHTVGASNALVRVQARRAKLLGLDAPQRLEHSGTEQVELTGPQALALLLGIAEANPEPGPLIPTTAVRRPSGDSGG